MSGVFYGTIQTVEAEGEHLAIRCVREFFHADGLMHDDVWIWEIERPEKEKVALLRSMTGRAVDYFEVADVESGQSLRISVDDERDAVVISGKCVRRREEPRNKHDIENVVAQMSQRIARDESDYLALSQRLTAIATFVEQKIDRIQRRAAFAQQRDSQKAGSFGREIEDLQGILRKLKEPNKPVDPTPRSAQGNPGGSPQD